MRARVDGDGGFYAVWGGMGAGGYTGKALVVWYDRKVGCGGRFFFN